MTPIPNFLFHQWNILQLFGKCISKKDVNSRISIYFKNENYDGAISFVKGKSRKCRLYFDKKLEEALKSVYVMSYMRSIEERLRKDKPEYKNEIIEEEIPFWEFLDLEFDAKNKLMYLTAHYVQKPLYIELFKEIVKSHVLFNIENVLNSKDDMRIAKSNWKPKSALKNQLEAKNVIYNLINNINKEIYIGEAQSLLTRLNGNRPEIPNWTHYRFDSLPNGLTKQQRVAIERMLIRVFASFIKNSKGIESKDISEYRLTNTKIDS